MAKIELRRKWYSEKRGFIAGELWWDEKKVCDTLEPYKSALPPKREYLLCTALFSHGSGVYNQVPGDGRIRVGERHESEYCKDVLLRSPAVYERVMKRIQQYLRRTEGQTDRRTVRIV